MESAEAAIARKKPAGEAGFLRCYTTDTVIATARIGGLAVRVVAMTKEHKQSNSRLLCSGDRHRPEAVPPKLLRIQLMTKRGSGLGVA